MTDYQKRRALELSGYDFNEWDIDDTDNIVPKIKQSPSISTTPLNSQSPEIPKPSDTPLETFGKSAATSAFPAIAGGIGAGLGMGALKGSVLGPWGTLGGGIAGALAAAFAARKVQSAILPEEIEANVAASQAANPKSAIAGSIATMPLGGLNPSPTILARGLGAIPKALTGMSRTADESAALMNVGLGAGIGGAQAVAEPLVQGEMPRGQDVLLNTLLGAAFNKPNVIGRRLGFENPEIPRRLPDIRETAPRVSPSRTTSPIQTMPDVAQTLGARPRTPQENIAYTAAQDPFSGNIGERPIGTTGARTEIVTPNELALQTMEGEGGIPQREPFRNPRLEAFEQASIERAAQDLAEQRRAKAELDRQEASNLASENAARAMELQTGLQRQQVAAQPEIRTKPIVTTELGVDIMPDYTGVGEQARSEVVKESAADLAARRTEAKLSGQERPKYSEQAAVEPTRVEQPLTKLQREVNEQLEAKGISGKPTDVWTKMLQDFGITHRRTKVQEDGSIINESTGKPIAGSATFSQALNKWLVKLNPEKQALDTGAHEMAGHAFFSDLRNSPKSGDREFVLKFEKAVADSPEFKAINEARKTNGEELWTPEEFIATEQGLEFVNRQLNLKGESALKTYWKDLWSHIKTKYSKASPEEMRRLLQYRFQNDPAFHRYFKTSIAPTVEGVAKTSEEGAVKSIPSYKVSIQHPQVPGDKGYVQVDEILNGENTRSLNPEKAIKEGIKIPSTEELMKLPQGKYSLEDINSGKVGGAGKPSLTKEEVLPTGKEAVQALMSKYNLSRLDALNLLHKERERHGVSTDDLVKMSEESAISNQGDEGKTPTPFKQKELDKSTEVRQNVYRGGIEAVEQNPSVAPEGLEEVRKGRALISVERPKENIKNQDAPAIKERSSFLPILTSRIDKIQEKVPTPTGEMVTKNLHSFAGESDLQAGRIGNRLIEATRDFNEKSIERVYRYLHQVDDTGDSSINLNAQEKKLSDSLIEILRQPRREQIELGLQVKEGTDYFRTAGIKPDGYMFNMLDPKVAHVWAEKPSSVEAKRYDAAYIEHLKKKGVTDAEAQATLKEYKGALGSNIARDIEFGALRKAEGKGLPWEIVDKNFASAASRYGRRAGSDLAFFKWIQRDPKMLKALNLRDQFGNLPDEKLATDVEDISPNSAVKEALRSVFGLDTPRNLTAMAAARSVNNTIMGVGTAARNILQMPAFVAQYVQLKQLPLVVKAITNLSNSRKRAFENNAVRASFSDYDAAGYYEGNPNPTIRLFNRYSDFMRKYQGRNLSDKFEGEFYYSLGELLAVDNIARAKAGDKEAKRFVERFGDIAEGGSEALLKKSKITEDDIARVAKRFVDATRGTYTAEGLPTWAIEGEFAPFTALSRWSIEKSNTIWKDVIEPARQGIYGPLLRYILGSAGVGFLVEEFNELLSNKRGGEAKLNEVLASGDKGDLIARAIATAQLGSFAGIVSDGAQLASSVARGKGMKYNQPLSFPLYTFLTDTLAGNISGAANAIKEGEDPFETLAQFVTSLSTQSVQSLRYLDNNFIHPEKAKRKEKFRDYNIWQELTDKKDAASIATDAASEYKNMGAKKFKQEGDIAEAMSMLPSLIENALNKSKTSSGSFDIEKLRAELRKIKQTSYQTMPDPDNMPESFLNYLSFLRKTQGEEEAQDRLTDYIKRREVNKVKSKAIPSV